MRRSTSKAARAEAPRKRKAAADRGGKDGWKLYLTEDVRFRLRMLAFKRGQKLSTVANEVLDKGVAEVDAGEGGPTTGEFASTPTLSIALAPLIPVRSPNLACLGAKGDSHDAMASTPADATEDEPHTLGPHPAAPSATGLVPLVMHLGQSGTRLDIQHNGRLPSSLPARSGRVRWVAPPARSQLIRDLHGPRFPSRPS